jgi:hypothetical protein
MARLFRVAIFIAFIFSAKAAFAACHTVTPSGSGSQTGADWNNAYAGLPSTLTRGDIYYLADGNYSSFHFSTAASGTATIEFRKAQTYDNCTSTGWNAATMGAAQAHFGRGIAIDSSYFILNGNGQQTLPGCGGAPGATITSNPPNITDCGIVIDDTSCTSPCIQVATYSGGNITVEYVELRANSTPADNEDNFWQGSGSGPTTWKHIYGHNAGAVYFQYGCSQRNIQYSYFWGTECQGVLADGTHGQYSYCGSGDSNGVEANNIYRDITGSAVFTFAFPDDTETGWKFYNNVFFNSTTYDNSGGLTFGTVTNGILACFNSGSVCTDFTFSQNTIINKGYATGVEIDDTTSGGSATVQNNLWYQSSTPSFTGLSTITQDHNSFIASGSGCASGTGNVCDSSGPNPFVSWTTGNFNLASDNADWNNRLALGAPFTVDISGNVFTTDRGAYQYNGSAAQTPQPPTGLSATVEQ